MENLHDTELGNNLRYQKIQTKGKFDKLDLRIRRCQQEHKQSVHAGENTCKSHDKTYTSIIYIKDPTTKQQRKC